VGRAVLFAHLALSPVLFSRWTLEAFESTKVALLVAAAIVLGALAPGALAPRGLGRDRLGLGVVLLLASAVVSTAVSRSPWTSLLGAHESYFGLTTLLAYAVLFFATRRLCETADDARRLLLAPVIGAAVAATYALVQLGGIDPIRYGRVSGLGGFTRPFATMGHPNFLSAFLVMSLPLVVYALVRGWRQGRRLAAGSLAAVAVGALAATAVTVSRGAWLALAAAALVLVAGALAAGERRAAATLGMVAGGAAAAVGVLALLLPGNTGAVVLTGLVQRVRQFGDSAGRWHIWQAAWGIFRDHPIAGSGLDTFQIAFADQRTAAYWNIEWNASPTRAHNEALNLLATQGALGGLAALVLAAGVLLTARRALRTGGDRLLAVALVAGLVAFAVQDLFSFTVAGCGTLAVTQAALLSRLAGPLPEPAPPGDGVAGFAATLGAVVVLVPALLAHNLAAGPLLDEPARVGGAALVLLALLAAAGAVWSLAQPDGPAPAGGGARAPVGPPPHPLAVAGRGLAAAALLAVLVLRPLAAAWAAHEGVRLTPAAPASAVERLERATRLDPLNELYWVRLGSAAHAQARVAADAGARRRALERARAAYERAIRLVPANSYNHANLGRALGDLAREGGAPPAAAYAAFDRALGMDPNNAYFYADAANAALSLDDPERARDYAARATALYPRFGFTRAQLGYAALAQQRPAEAIAPLREALEAQWHGADRAQALAASNLAAAYLQLGRAAEAHDAARAALQRAPATVEARFNLAKALERLGRRDEAIAEYRRLLAEQPGYTLARDALRALGAPPDRP
jgi:tetratricopeptide (TPR) repeat protein